VRIDPERKAASVPRYLYRKLAEYGFKACTAISPSRRRFYLVRTAAALGEIAGHRHPPAHDAAHTAITSD
jgi:hypothetical protein